MLPRGTPPQPEKIARAGVGKRGPQQSIPPEIRVSGRIWLTAERDGGHWKEEGELLT
jgi:hypothetical protein